MAIISAAELLLELGLSSGATTEEDAIAASCIKRAEGAIKRFLHYDPAQQTHTEYYPQQDLRSSADTGVWEVNENEAYLRTMAEAVTSELQLRCLPVRSITSLHIDYDGKNGTRVGSFAADALKVEGVDFWPNYDQVDSMGAKVCSDGIIKSGGQWPVTPGCVKVIYVAGYTFDELRGDDEVIDASPIWEVALDEAARRVRKMFTLKKSTRVGFVPGIVTRESLGDYSYSIDSSSAQQVTMVDKDLLQSSIEKLIPFINMGWCLGG
ncbi:hypothetical protein M0R72_14190 [Candidatus Pacearchaeota archaeon]|jgi:hypothetical protein|nr:hypothetical protein [Candidatus Pacearchaeota archaeon]